jgi:Zn-dependent protease
MVVLPILTALVTHWPLGFASAPYDPQWARRYPKRAAVMALAGPAANLVLVLLAALLVRVGIAGGVFYPPDSVRFGDLAASNAEGFWAAAAFMLSVFFSVNLLLFAFNLLPLPPLDGSGAIPLLLSERATAKYQDVLFGNPALQIIGMLIAWRVFGVLFDPVFTGAVNLLYPGMSYR